MAEAGLQEKFVLHWGEMASRWGVNRTVAQIHALLYFAGRSMNAEEIAAALGVARSNVSTSLRELQNWGLVKLVMLPGDRRDRFEGLRDPWDLLRVIVRERKEREFDPTIAFLSGCVASAEFARLDAGEQKRLRETLALMQSLAQWTEQMLAMENASLKRLAKLGSRIQSFLKAA